MIIANAGQKSSRSQQCRSNLRIIPGKQNIARAYIPVEETILIPFWRTKGTILQRTYGTKMGMEESLNPRTVAPTGALVLMAVPPLY
jgi:hypothetical protein